METVDLVTNTSLTKASEFIIYPWLQPGRLTLLVGPTEAGKTTLTLELLAACLKGGHLWTKYPCQRVEKVLYLHAEHTLDTLQEAASLRGDIPVGRVSVIQDFGMDGAALLRKGQPNISLISKLVEAVKDLQPGLIIAEPVSAFLEVSENDNREARALIQVLCQLATIGKAAVLTHHHVGKTYFDPTRERPQGIPIGDARGAQAWEDAAERVLYLKRGEKGQIRLETPKPKGFPVKPVILAFDEDTLTYTRIPHPPVDQDLLAIYEYRLEHPTMSIRDVVAYFTQLWKASARRVHLLIKRAYRVGLISQAGDCTLSDLGESLSDTVTGSTPS